MTCQNKIVEVVAKQLKTVSEVNDIFNQIVTNCSFCSLQTREMTTVEFGGGPTLEARRKFSNLKEGSEIPK